MYIRKLKEHQGLEC